MRGKSGVVWTLRELTECIRSRQKNRFDANIGVSGSRGNGKSTFLFKIFNSFKRDGFKQYKQQVYSRDSVIRLLSDQRFGFCWDDEAINSGYKRDFQKGSQIDLIKIITNYRDNFNIYGSALPFFYNLDKALRELVFMHVHLISRGAGVILLPLEGQIHTQDPWDTVTNKKIEARENARLEKDANAKFRFHKLTTFAGFVYFSAMTKKQQNKYDKIKQSKRAQAFKDMEKETRQKTFHEKLYDALMTGNLTREGITQACLLEGKKDSVAIQVLSKMLKDNHIDKRTQDLLKVPQKELKSKLSPQISNLIPDLP